MGGGRVFCNLTIETTNNWLNGTYFDCKRCGCGFNSFSGERLYLNYGVVFRHSTHNVSKIERKVKCLNTFFSEKLWSMYKIIHQKKIKILSSFHIFFLHFNCISVHFVFHYHVSVRVYCWCRLLRLDWTAGVAKKNKIMLPWKYWAL